MDRTAQNEAPATNRTARPALSDQTIGDVLFHVADSLATVRAAADAVEDDSAMTGAACILGRCRADLYAVIEALRRAGDVGAAADALPVEWADRGGAF
jgi:hypothetical protein